MIASAVEIMPSCRVGRQDAEVGLGACDFLRAPPPVSRTVQRGTVQKCAFPAYKQARHGIRKTARHRMGARGDGPATAGNCHRKSVVTTQEHG